MGSIPIGSANETGSPPVFRSRVMALARRLAALAYDLLLVAGLLLLTSFALIVLREGAAIETGSGLFRVLLFLQVAAYFIGFWRRGAQTPGMRTWGLRVERNGGGSITTVQAVARFVGALLSIATLGLGMLWILIDRDGQAWQDRLSATRIVPMQR